MGLPAFGNSLVAATTIAKGAQILAIPSALCLPDDLIAGWGLDDRPAGWGARLAARLLSERQQGLSSAWAPYLAALPRSLICGGLLCDDGLMTWYGAARRAFPRRETTPARALTRRREGLRQAVQYPPAVQKAANFSWQLQHTHAAACQDGAGELSLEDWAWAYRMVHSRTFRGPPPRPGAAPARLMVPLADLANHSAAANAAWEVGADGFRMLALEDIKPGQQIFIDYGERSTDDFFLFYGFIPHDEADTVELFCDEAEALQWLADCSAATQAGTLPADSSAPQMLEAAPVDLAWLLSEDNVGDGGAPDTWPSDTVLQGAARGVEGEADVEARSNLVAAPEGRCSEALLELFEEALGDTAAAEDAVRARAKELLAEWPSSLEDEDELRTLLVGAEHEHADTEEEEDEERRRRAMMVMRSLIVRFRLGKKRILEALLSA